MRTFSDVERERMSARAVQPGAEKTVHRSSLLVPELENCRSVISFLNHFLIKRNIAEVSCRIIAIDDGGRRVAQKTVLVNEPRVYTIDLSDLFSEANANTYVVEFFSAQNLAIPFPAVMVNHFGDRTVNMVHAYNRALNDVFEQDNEVETAPAESSVDVRIGEDIDTFVVFASGPTPFKGEINFELAKPGRRRQRDFAIDMPRLTQRSIGLKEVFPDLENDETGVLRVRTPYQLLFFGRMLAGQRLESGAFAANHTYYDTSNLAPEYFKNNRPSALTHPFFPELKNSVRFYPFWSPSQLRLSTSVYDHKGRKLHSFEIGELAAPCDDFVSFDVDAALARQGIAKSEVSAFRLEASPVEGNTPTRIPHQRVFGAGGLESSVVLSLHNENQTPPMRGFVWGQMVAGRDFESYLGISRTPNADPNEVLLLQLFGEEGLIEESRISIPPNTGHVVKLSDTAASTLCASDKPHCVWYLLTGTKPDFGAQSAVADRNGNCTGEHSF